MKNEIETRNRIKDIYSTKSEIFAQHNGHLKYCFKTYFADVYDDIYQLTSFLDAQNPTFRARIHCIVNDIYEIPICVVCGKEIDIHDRRPSSQIQRTCCISCARKDPLYHQKCKETKAKQTPEQRKAFAEKRKQTLELLEKQDSAYWMKRYEKAKLTKKKHFGDENYMSFGSGSYHKMMEDRYGDAYYSNQQKAAYTYKSKSSEEKQAIIQKRKQTREKLKSIDHDYQQKITEKSISTRKQHHGDDFTNRAKCRKTLIERYGVENAYQIEGVKQKIKQNNIDKYGVEFYSSTDECKDKVRSTCIEKYGVSNFFASEDCKKQMKQTNLEKYGVEYNWQRDDIKEKIANTNLERYGCRNPMQNNTIAAKTRHKYELVMVRNYGVKSYFSSDEYKHMCIEKYGVDHPMKNPEFRKNQQTRYIFENINFDSGAELIYYIWLIDNDIEFEFQPAVSFEYTYDGKTHVYQPDFKVGDQIVEIKGNHFFTTDDMMCNPYDHTQDGLYEAKHQCMLRNHVKILKSSELNIQQKHFVEKFGTIMKLRDFKKK